MFGQKSAFRICHTESSIFRNYFNLLIFIWYAKILFLCKKGGFFCEKYGLQIVCILYHPLYHFTGRPCNLYDNPGSV